MCVGQEINFNKQMLLIAENALVEDWLNEQFEID
jgi:hypothetical protein